MASSQKRLSRNSRRTVTPITRVPRLPATVIGGKRAAITGGSSLRSHGAVVEPRYKNLIDFKYCNCCGKPLNKHDIKENIHLDYTPTGKGESFHIQLCSDCLGMLVMGCRLSPRTC